jgi:hypothetical protein
VLFNSSSKVAAGINADFLRLLPEAGFWFLSRTFARIVSMALGTQWITWRGATLLV